MTHSYMTHSYVWHDSFMNVIINTHCSGASTQSAHALDGAQVRVYVCYIFVWTHSYVRHYSFLIVTSLIVVGLAHRLLMS